MSTETTEPGPAAAPAAPAISDDEIRDWARSTGRAAGARGRIPAALRAEYEGIARELGGPPPAEPAAEATTSRPAEPAAEAPRAARAETRPRPVKGKKRPRSRIAAWLAGDSASSSSKSGSKKAAAEPKPRTPLDKFAGKMWGWVADGFEHVNIPVARCMAWQAPYVGLMAEDALAGTIIDRIIQPIARSEEKLTVGAAVIAMPFIVAAIQNPANTPDAGLGGVARAQILEKLLEECIDAQLEIFGTGNMAERVRKSEAERAERRGQVDTVLDMIWASMPEPATAQEAAEMAAEERERRAAASDAMFGSRPPAGATVLPGEVLPDTRGQAAERAAANMAAAGEAAAQRAAIASVSLGTTRL